ncbi:hypothetical protein CDD82_5957 [Ophiocordyceps australis]|uniref:Transcription factor Iwr1 domain-containing protein n=1 Tax=Ophiocordyceps australis TaxID=1399860 RepID=A0A2C5Y3K3_9HYPO|nr:hypothetical protein CDD82_5957 [Ophiocordyceps australis]
MSIPPQLIRVKRKRADDSPVAFLHLGPSHKRHRSHRDWVYQHRSASPQPTNLSPQPAIHTTQAPPALHQPPSTCRPIANPKKRLASHHHEPRRFHVARSALQHEPNSSGATATVFVERVIKKKRCPRHVPETPPPQAEAGRADGPANHAALEHPCGAEKHPKPVDEAHRVPRAPSSDIFVHAKHHDMEIIAAEMDKWVLHEIGANLHSMEQRKQAQHFKPSSRFKPKPPAQRYFERHSQPAPVSEPRPEQIQDQGDASDWVMDEYVRVPADTVAWDTSRSDFGVLVLEEDEETLFFSGCQHQDQDDQDVDDQDENAESHYTADYPEEEQVSDDEHHASLYSVDTDSDDVGFSDEENHSTTHRRHGSGSEDELRTYLHRRSVFG